MNMQFKFSHPTITQMQKKHFLCLVDLIFGRIHVLLISVIPLGLLGTSGQVLKDYEICKVCYASTTKSGARGMLSGCLSVLLNVTAITRESSNRF